MNQLNRLARPDYRECVARTPDPTAMLDLDTILTPPPYAVVWQSGPGRVHAGRDGAGRVRVTATRSGERVYDVRLTAVGEGCDAEEWATALAEARRVAEL